jgi:hypothetical protein
VVVQGSKVVVIQYLTLERRTCQTVKNLYVFDQVERLRTLATLHDAERNRLFAIAIPRRQVRLKTPRIDNRCLSRDLFRHAN